MVNTEFRNVLLLGITVKGKFIKLKTAAGRINFTFVLLERNDGWSKNEDLTTSSQYDIFTIRIKTRVNIQ